MEKLEGSASSIEIEHLLHVLLNRCAAIEGKSVGEVLHQLLSPQLQKYSHGSLEEWELARERQEMEHMLLDFEKDSSFNPNHIPFDKQIIGLRRKLDELEREISISGEKKEALEELRFSLLEELNFAEKEALRKHQEKRKQRSIRWREACKKFPVGKNSAD